jgi:hypothetical protein
MVAGNGGATGASSATSATPAPTQNTAPNILSLFTPFSWTNGALWLAGLIGLLVTGSGVGTFVWLSRRTSEPAMPAGEQPTTPAPAAPPSFDADTLPLRRMDT